MERLDLKSIDFEALLPLAVSWAQEQERIILEIGVPLSPSELDLARQVGVVSCERVRLLRVNEVPLPEDDALGKAARLMGFVSDGTAGLTLRYGIAIRHDCWGDERLIAHELTHTHQYERLGGFEPFLRTYLSEFMSVGYYASPLEREAVTTARRICG